jgi:hypothetical protein
MKKPKQNSNWQPDQRIKVQLDERTVIFINKKSSLDEWIKKYPNARVISSETFS